MNNMNPLFKVIAKISTKPKQHGKPLLMIAIKLYKRLCDDSTDIHLQIGNIIFQILVAANVSIIAFTSCVCRTMQKHTLLSLRNPVITYLT